MAGWDEYLTTLQKLPGNGRGILRAMGASHEQAFLEGGCGI